MASPVVYSDFDISFLPNPVTGDLLKKENDEAVTQAIQLLVLTAFNERVFQPSLGTNLAYALFEPLDDITLTILAKTISDTVKNFERRADLISVDVYTKNTPTGEPLDDNSVWIEVIVRVLNLPNLISAGVLLRRIR